MASEVISTEFVVTRVLLHTAGRELSKYDLARHESLRSSVIRAPDRCTGGHGFDSRRGLRFFLCPTLVTNWVFHLSYYFPSLTFTIFLSSLSGFSLFVSFRFAERYCLKCFFFPLYYVIREFHRFLHRGKALEEMSFSCLGHKLQ